MSAGGEPRAGQEFEEALKVAERFMPDFNRRLTLTEEILKFYRQGWSDGADHILAQINQEFEKRGIKP